MLSQESETEELETTKVIVREELGLDDRSTKFKVLLADDEPDALTLFRAILEQFDYDLIMAEDGEQALELYHQINPDIAVLDFQMPGKTGLEVCQTIKEQNDKKFVPVIIVTSQSDPYAKVDGLKAGADDYITKPFFCEELQIKIASFLRIKRLTDELLRDRDDLEIREKELVMRLYEMGL